MEVGLYTALCLVGSSDGSHGSFTQIGDTGVFVGDAETLLLSSHAALPYSFTGAWLRGLFFSILKT